MNDQVRGGNCEGIDLYPRLEHHPPRPQASERDARRLESRVPTQVDRLWPRSKADQWLYTQVRRSQVTTKLLQLSQINMQPPHFISH